MRDAGNAPRREIVFEPKSATRHNVSETIQEHIDTGMLFPGAAAKLNGSIGWLASNAYGRIGRIGAFALKARQYASESIGAISKELEVALHFLLRLTQTVSQRTVSLQRPAAPPLIGYSDAEYTPGKDPQLGWVIFEQTGEVVCAGHMKVSSKVTD